MNNMDWNVQDDLLVKEFEFLNLKQATKFAEEIRIIAVQEEHHPGVEHINGNIVKVTITPINGSVLASRDIRLANLINKIG